MIKTADLTLRQKKIIVILASIVLIYLLFGFLAAPFAVRNILENQIAGAINRKVSVGPVRVNPITLSVTLRDLSIQEAEGGAFVKLDEAYANLQTSSLLKWALVLKSIRVVNPQIDLVRMGATSFNFSDIGNRSVSEQEPSPDGGGIALAVYDVSVQGGQILLDDRVVSVHHKIDNLEVHVSDFSTRPSDADVYTRFKLAARVNGADTSLSGKTRPFAPKRETKAEVKLASLDAPHYLPYVALPENLQIRSLIVETDAELDFRMQERGKPELIVAGVLSLIDARLADGNGDPFVHHPRMTFDLLPSKVLAGELRLAELSTADPEYYFKRLPSGEIYMPFLAPKVYKKAETKAAEDTSGDFQPVITIDTLNLKHGVVHFTDLSNSDAFATTVSDLNLEMENIGLNVDRTATVRFSMSTEADESATLSGTVSLASMQAAGEIEVSDIEISRYLPYYQDNFDFKAATGRLSLGGAFRFRREGETPLISLSNVHVDVSQLAVVDEGDDEPLISLDRLRLSDTTAESATAEFAVGRLDLTGAVISIRREKDGVLNLVKAFMPKDAGTFPTDSVAVPPEARPASLQTAHRTPAITLAAVNIADVSVDVEDRMPNEPVRLRLDQIAVSASNVSTVSGSTGKAELKLRWEQDGQFRAGGNIAIAPLTLNLTVNAGNLDIRPFQPYISDQAGMIVTQGIFGTEGRLKVSQGKSAAPVINYTGKAVLNRFASIDRKNANDFLKWDGLLLDHLEVGVNPDRVSIDQISLSDFFARVIVDSDGSVNLVSMFSGPDGQPAVSAEEATVPSPDTKASSPPESGATAPLIRIARVSLSKGDVDFSDRFIRPNFNARFHDLGGRVSGLQSIAQTRADVLLEGMWADHAPVKITGRINPLVADPYVDLDLNISDIELSPFSPYSGKYLGYILEKGKLTFNVSYLMEDRKLEGKNSIYINQLTLGDTVDSPEAVSLPIKLAVALLKDREGNIELDLPVSGDLNDPQFRIGKVILTVLKNLIVKIVSSPFAALGALADGGEELSYLDFAPGISDISPENADKMDKLAKILYERPGLKLDIRGVATPKGDQHALQAALVENRLKAQKLENMMKKGQSAVPLEEIVIGEAERPSLIEQVFETSGITVPLDAGGKPVEPTPENMQLLLRTHTDVTPDDYRKLANLRAFNAKNYLLDNGQVERERVFIVEPQSGSQPAPGDASGEGQVVFSLK